ncbi:hypothetical protein PV325_000110 [Microctonus aethiopoides]|uniref:Non-structural maintenance of chromosomes element 1 homolog n=1 Tax=Microctonus aethiopoides TaxID=144406 RepID=A0AA39C718_9HYME|nr:hypothetical protein PV325_000110 [Microctonus aethiopoides]KAK0159038.1 hypothetical protein PV328_009970 [Microctonus aethiopoides]
MERTEQIFIQALMHKGVINEQTMRYLCTNIFERTDQTIQYYIAKANKRLECLGMGIKSANCELTGKKYWLFTSTVIPDYENINYDSKLFLEFTRCELKYLSKIFGMIINSDEGYISSINCINLVGEMEEHFTRSQADEFIKKMTQKMWLSQVDGHIYLGVRSIIEFLPLFKTKFRENLESCSLCKLTVFFGQNCETCNIKFHTYCLEKVLKMSSSAKCMNCHSFLNKPTLFNDETIMNVEDQSHSNNEHEPSTSRKRTRRTNS